MLPAGIDRIMDTVEIAIRLAGKRKTEHIFEPVLGMVFDSKEEGYELQHVLMGV